MADRVKAVAAEEAERVKELTTEAVKSQAYLYPIKGIFYFISHRDLWRPLISKLTPTLTLSVGVTTFMFLIAYLPQAAIMAFTSGPVAAISAALLTLSESSTIVNIISRNFFIEDALIDTFDGVLISKNYENLVKEGRQVTSGGDNIARLGKLVKRPFARFSPNAIVRYLMYLPLNFIPVIGTLVFIILQGKRAGPASHARYFQLKGWSSTRSEQHVKEHRGAYTAFGVVASLLELVPFANLIFAFTNTVGAGLYACDLERGLTTAPGLRDQAKKAR